jgi:hypothetical protein
MGRREEAPSVALNQLDAQARHNRVLLHALQTAHPVLYKDRSRFIHTLTYQISGGGIETAVYLTGSPEPLAPEEISLAPDIT